MTLEGQGQGQRHHHGRERGRRGSWSRRTGVLFGSLLAIGIPAHAALNPSPVVSVAALASASAGTSATPALSNVAAVPVQIKAVPTTSSSIAVAPSGLPGIRTPVLPATPALRVTSIAAKCGADDARGDVNSPHRNDVAVEVTLDNTGSATVTGALSVLLTQLPAPISCDKVNVPPGRRQPVSCWLPIDLAEPVVGVRLQPSSNLTLVGPQTSTLRFSCVAAPPANNVVVRAPSGSGCNVRSGKGGNWVGRAAAALPGSDRLFCAYSWKGSSSPDLSSFAGLEWELDEPVVTSLGVAGGDLAELTDARLGITDASGATARAATPVTRVRVAVLDTAALDFDREDADDTSDHGRLVGLAARHIACGASSRTACPIDIDNRLALPIVSAGPSYEEDLEHGGYLGTRTQLATALHDLLDDWEAAGQLEPLVINLSLGWHSRHECTGAACAAPWDNLPSRFVVPARVSSFDLSDVLLATGVAPATTQRLGTEAVFRELVRARCLGALVFAAAGNTSGDDRDGPLLPGAWNRMQFPSSAGAGGEALPECRDFVDMRQQSKKPAGYGVPRGPLVEAVAATAYDGQPLGTTRWHSLPRLSAYGAAITLPDARPLAAANGGLRGPASGSSFATAFVSGAAARVWAQSGANMAAHDVVTALHATARMPVLDAAGRARSAELFGGRTAPAAREVSACTVPAIFGLPCVPPRELEHLELPVADAPDAAAVCLIDTITGEVPAQCPLEIDPVQVPTTSHEDCMPGSAGCDAVLGVLSIPWVVPQPWGIDCATCSEFHEDWGGFTAYDIKLDVARTAFKPLSPSEASGRAPKIVRAAIRAGDVENELSLLEIKEQASDGRDILRGDLYLDLYIPPAPPSLVVTFSRISGTIGKPVQLETSVLSTGAR